MIIDVINMINIMNILKISEHDKYGILDEINKI